MRGSGHDQGQRHVFQYSASICDDGIDRQRYLDVLDAEIDAFNDLIAAQCSGS
jgi:hypothetical protein